MRIFALLLMLVSFQGYCQNLFTISLEEFKMNANSLLISEVIDARRDQRVLGIIQRGVVNRKDLAVFAKPGLQEIEELIQRSGIFSKEKGIAIRISRLAISEVTSIWRETAKAELSLDFFINFNNNYYYIRSAYASAEPKAFDVTHFHPFNIIDVFEKALARFSTSKNEIKSDHAYTREELTDPEVSFREVSSMPIVKASHYKNGYYASYEEFVNNDPSISLDCLVTPGSTTLVKCGDTQEPVNIYGYAKANQLFILFHHDFFPLEKDNKGFAFRGPREISNKDVSNYYKSMVVARQVGEKRGHYTTYRLELNTGSITNTAGF